MRHPALRRDEHQAVGRCRSEYYQSVPGMRIHRRDYPLGPLKAISIDKMIATRFKIVIAVLFPLIAGSPVVPFERLGKRQADRNHDDQDQ